MTDLEKVIKGLECCINRSELRCINECPYYTDELHFAHECWLPLNRDALALLKAQEPRVMTPEEVIGNIILGRDRVIWFEFRDSIVPMNTKSLAYDDYLVDDDMPILNDPNIEWRDSDGKKDGVIVAEYNDVFRCWTSRPTDAQRETTPWE